MITERVNIKDIKPEICSILHVHKHYSPTESRIMLYAGNQFGKKYKLLIDTFCPHDLLDKIADSYISVNVKNYLS